VSALADEEKYLSSLAKEQAASISRLLEHLGRLQLMQNELQPALASLTIKAVSEVAVKEPDAGLIFKTLEVKPTSQPFQSLELDEDPNAVKGTTNSGVTDLEDILSGVTDLREDGTMHTSPKPEKMNSNDMTQSMTSEYAGRISPSYATSHIKAQATVEQLLSEYEPGRRELMLIRLKSGLDYFAGFLVLMNSMVLLLQFEMEGRTVGLTVGLSDGPAWEQVIPALQIVDIIFVFIFLVEWLIRISVERWQFVKDYANLFDTILVLGGLVDTYINLAFVGETSASKSIVILRLMRAMKSFRAIRMVRSLRFFRGLRVLVKACQCFLPSLCWSMVLLLMFMAMGALMLGNLLQSFVDDDDQDLDDRQWIWMHYGTAYRALYTFFEITFAGNWPTNTRPVLEKVNHGFAIFFVCYITLVVFAIIRVISAVFLKDTLDAAQNDAEALVVDKMHKKQEFMVKLEGIFKAIDDTGSGIISEERLTTILSNPKVAAYFQTMDIDVHEGRALFHVLNNGEGGVSLDEFIDGILKCKGPARAIDQVAMHAEIKALDFKLTRLVRTLDSAHVISASRSFVDSGNMKSVAEHLKVFRMDEAQTRRRMSSASLTR